jgi:molybdopterin synthase sulfur carrier subunit
MQIQFKLFATLMDYLPAEAVKNVVTLEVDESTTPHQLTDKYGVPRAEVHLVLINGIYADEAARDNPLNQGDALAIWPPVAGG